MGVIIILVGFRNLHFIYPSNDARGRFTLMYLMVDSKTHSLSLIPSKVNNCSLVS